MLELLLLLAFERKIKKYEELKGGNLNIQELIDVRGLINEK